MQAIICPKGTGDAEGVWGTNKFKSDNWAYSGVVMAVEIGLKFTEIQAPFILLYLHTLFDALYNSHFILTSIL